MKMPNGGQQMMPFGVAVRLDVDARKNGTAEL
jgi:hypothetical protein